MKRFWNFIVVPQNLAVLVAIGSALGFLWNHLAPPPTPDNGKLSQPGAKAAQTNEAKARDDAVIIQGSSAGRDIEVER